MRSDCGLAESREDDLSSTRFNNLLFTLKSIVQFAGDPRPIGVQTVSDSPLPISTLVQIPESGEPFLQATKCKSCDAIALKPRMACANCGARDSNESLRLANKGKLHAFSIVYRAFPGIDVPFISAIADLDGGGTIKTNLIGIDPDPEKIQLGMDVDVVFEVVNRKDSEGNEYLGYFIKPAA
jgi:uncharacterized OB-fold protein